MSSPRIASAWRSASSGSPASLIPPALPRPPVSTCALTTTGPPSSSAAARASAASSPACPPRRGSRSGGKAPCPGTRRGPPAAELSQRWSQRPWTRSSLTAWGSAMARAGARRASRFRVARGRGLRAARPERRRQVDDGQGADDADEARQGPGGGREPRRRPRARCGAALDRLRASELRRRPRRDRAREPDAPGPGAGDVGARLRLRVGRAARAVRDGRCGRPHRPRVLGRDEAAPRRGARARPRARASSSSTSRPRASTPRRARRCGTSWPSSRARSC